MSSSKIPSVVILFGAPLTSQNYERLGIPYLKKYLNVIVYDCTSWLNRYTSDLNLTEVDYFSMKPINSLTTFLDDINLDKPKYVIDAIGYNSITNECLEILCKLNIRYVIWSPGPLPVQGLSIRLRSLKNRTKRYITRYRTIQSSTPTSFKKVTNASAEKSLPLISFERLLRPFNSLKSRRLFNTELPPMSLIAGKKSKRFNPYVKKSGLILWIGSEDYYTFKLIQREISSGQAVLEKEPYILFIDENVPDASDWNLLQIAPPVNGNSYFTLLNQFFTQIENENNLKVRIAGHPSSINDSQIADKFGGREVIFNRTAELAAQCELALLHASTAASFAVLAKKPILILTSIDLDNSDYGPFIRSLAKSLRKKPIFIDKNPDTKYSLLFKGNQEKQYKRYEEKYLRSPNSTENAPWEAFIEHILSELD